MRESCRNKAYMEGIIQLRFAALVHEINYIYI